MMAKVGEVYWTNTGKEASEIMSYISREIRDPDGYWKIFVNEFGSIIIDEMKEIED